MLSTTRYKEALCYRLGYKRSHSPPKVGTEIADNKLRLLWANLGGGRCQTERQEAQQSPFLGNKEPLVDGLQMSSFSSSHPAFQRYRAAETHTYRSEERTGQREYFLGNATNILWERK